MLRSAVGLRRRETYRHLLDAVDEVRPQPPRFAGKLDVGYPVRQGAEKHPQFQAGEVAPEAEMRSAAAEANMRVG